MVASLIEPLYWILRMSGLAPYNGQGDRSIKAKLYSTAVYLVATIVLVAQYDIGIKTKPLYVLPVDYYSAILFIKFLNVTLCFFNIVFKSDTIVRFLGSLDQLCRGSDHASRRFQLKVVVFHIILFVAELLIYIPTKTSNQLSLVLRKLVSFIEQLSVCLFLCLTYTLKERFAHLNSVLLKLTVSTRSQFTAISQDHTQLANIAVQLNCLFNCQIMLMAIKYAFALASYSFSLIKLHRSASHAVLPTILLLLTAAILISRVVVAAEVCRATCEEGNKTVLLAHHAIIFEEDSESFVNDVREFSLSRVGKKVRFSGLRLFTIDRSFVLTLLMMVSTYVVMVIQIQDSIHATRLRMANATSVLLPMDVGVNVTIDGLVNT